MKIAKFALALIAVLAIAGFANAGYSSLSVQWGPGQVYFEVYKGGSYYHSPNPYYYYGDYYYYFPNNFRYYYNSQWFYQPSGWFYYNGASWYRDNAWVFYDNYWFYPRHNYYYYPPYFEPTIIQAQELDKPYCSGIDIATYTIQVQEGKTVYDAFWVENSSNFVFDIFSAEIIENDSEIEVIPTSVDAFAPEQGFAELSIRTQALEGIESKLSTIYVKVEGEFPETGLNCSKTEGFKASIEGIADSEESDSATNDSSVQEFTQITLQPSSYQGSTASFYASTTPEPAYSAPPAPRPPIVPEPKESCSSIQLFTKNYYLGENDSKTQNFIIKNSGEKTFYIESIQALEDSAVYNARALDTKASSINSKGALNVPVKVESFETAKDRMESASFQVSGVFEDNTYCSFTAVGASDFTVQIVADAEPAAQGNFTIYAPETIKVPSQGTEFSFAFINTTGKQGYLRVYSPNASTNPEVIVIPEGKSSVSASISVRNLDVNKAWLFYDVFIEGFEIPSKISRLEKIQVGEGVPGPIVQPPSQEPESPQVSIESTVQPNIDGSYDLNVIVSNESNFPIAGNVEVDVPGDWSVEGSTDVSLNALESKSILLKARPKEFNDEDVGAVITFSSSSGFRFSEPIFLKANKPAYAAAFAVLGANSFLIGIIIVIVIVLGLAYYSIKKHKAHVEMHKERWASASK